MTTEANESLSDPATEVPQGATLADVQAHLARYQAFVHALADANVETISMGPNGVILTHVDLDPDLLQELRVLTRSLSSGKALPRKVPPRRSPAEVLTEPLRVVAEALNALCLTVQSQYVASARQRGIRVPWSEEMLDDLVASVAIEGEIIVRLFRARATLLQICPGLQEPRQRPHGGIRHAPDSWTTPP